MKVFEYGVNSKISCTLDFSINFIFKQFFLAMKPFTALIFILTRGKNRIKKIKNGKSQSETGAKAGISSIGLRKVIQKEA